jgi:hypothetical protein
LGNLTKNQKKREKMRVAVKQSKQSTLDNMYFQFNIPKPKELGKPSKAIVINDIASTLKEDELVLKIGFSLLPSKAFFTKVNLDLFFQDHLLDSTPIVIPQSALLNDSLEFPQVLDMNGMDAGEYMIRVEMYEQWPSNEKLNFAVKEIIFQYTPQTRKSRLVKIPTVKSVVGAGLTVVSSAAKNIYREIEQDAKKESLSKRDEW